MKKLFALCALFCLPFSALAGEGYTVLFKTQGDFQYVRDSLETAIEGKGLVVNHTNKVAEMLERTGKDLGATKQVFEYGEQFEFCSATISRAMMEADPHAIVMCPYIVSVYKIPNDKNIYISYRKPPVTGNPALQEALAELEKLLADIIKDAL